jgi:toxin CcdB
VVPQVAITAARLTTSQVTPEFEVAGKRVILQPLETTSVPASALRQRVGSLKEHGQQVMDGLDELFTEAFG